MKAIYKQSIKTLALTFLGGVFGALVTLPDLQIETQAALGATAVLTLLFAARSLYRMQK